VDAKQKALKNEENPQIKSRDPDLRITTQDILRKA
jgi:hypothetical protein